MRSISSRHIGVSYSDKYSKWKAQRWSRNGKKLVHSGYFKNEETAAHASDSLAKKLMANGEQNHKLNFQDDDTDIHLDRSNSSKYLGVSYIEAKQLWQVQRRSKSEKKLVQNGTYKDEEKAAHASDTLARKLMANGELNHKLNFPDEDTEVYPEKTNFSEYTGVSYSEPNAGWFAQIWTKHEKKLVHNGTYKDEQTAAHASDTLARKLMANGEQNHRLNFPDDVRPEKFRNNKRKRSNTLDMSQNDDKFEE